MEKLKELLEYQKTDIELRKLLDEINRSEYNRKLEQARNEFNTAKNAVAECEKNAESVIAFYNSALAYCDECSQKIDELAVKMAAAENVEVEREYAAELEKLREALIETEKKLNANLDKTDKAIASYKDAQEKGKKIRDIYNGLKEKLAQFKREKEPAINALRTKLDQLRPSVPPEIYKTYSELTAEKLYPAFVQARESEKNHYRCFCGLELSQKSQSELNEKGYCRCDTCHRLIYKQ